MSAPTRNKQLEARVLVYATMYNQRRAASHFQIGETTVHDYKKRLETDPDLEALYMDLLERVRTQHWVISLNERLDEAMKITVDAMAKLDPDKDTMPLIIAGLDKLAEIAFTKEHLDNVAAENAKNAEAIKPIASSSEATLETFKGN